MNKLHAGVGTAIFFCLAVIASQAVFYVKKIKKEKPKLEQFEVEQLVRKEFK